jgi:hypothetical protein
MLGCGTKVTFRIQGTKSYYTEIIKVPNNDAAKLMMTELSMLMLSIRVHGNDRGCLQLN